MRLKTYLDFSDSIQLTNPDYDKFEPYYKPLKGKLVKVRDSKVNPRIGRNVICPKCDSGKKYKNCCGFGL